MTRRSEQKETPDAPPATAQATTAQATTAQATTAQATTAQATTAQATTAQAAESPAAASSAAMGATTDVPRKKRKKKRKASKGLRDLQRMERRFSLAAHRMARAVEKGVGTYRRKSERSARKTRDGALWDLPINSARGVATAMREASEVPVDLARAVDTPTVRRVVRFGTRMMLLPFGR